MSLSAALVPRTGSFCAAHLWPRGRTMAPGTRPFLSAFPSFSAFGFLNMAVFETARVLPTSIINTPSGCRGYRQISGGANSVTLLSRQSEDKIKTRENLIINHIDV